MKYSKRSREGLQHQVWILTVVTTMGNLLFYHIDGHFKRNDQRGWGFFAVDLSNHSCLPSGVGDAIPSHLFSCLMCLAHCIGPVYSQVKVGFAPLWAHPENLTGY